jgi:hypothetical protein
MRGSYIPAIKKEEEAKNSGLLPTVHHHSTGIDVPEIAADVHDDVTSTTENENVCNDFATKLSFREVHRSASDIDDNGENEGVVPLRSIHCCDDLGDTCTTGSPSAATRLSNDNTSNAANMRFVCDLGYGLPNEQRPRKEKLHAIAKQLVTFLWWQSQQQELSRYPLAPIHIILGKQCPKVTLEAQPTTAINQDESDANTDTAIENPTDTKYDSDTGEIRCEEYEEAKLIHESLLSRMHEVWVQLALTDPLPPFPEDIISFCYQPLHVFLQTCGGDTIQSPSDSPEIRYSDTIYLSPDSIHILDVTKPPPRNIIIGLLIDRRTIQYNRSVLRAQEHNIRAVRWPIENIMTNSCMIPQMIHKNEPLNVDCVLEGMQQWHWNIITQPIEQQQQQQQGGSMSGEIVRSSTITNSLICRQSFEMAAIQAIQHHIVRHPQRPLHKT